MSTNANGADKPNDDSTDNDNEAPRDDRPKRLWGWNADETDEDVIGRHDLHPTTGFYCNGIHVELGRVFRDPDMEQDQYLAVKDFDQFERTVTLEAVKKTPDGSLETDNGNFEPTGEERTVNWLEEGGRYIPV